MVSTTTRSRSLVASAPVWCATDRLSYSKATSCSSPRRWRQWVSEERGHKVYTLHAPEVECIGKGKARASYEFGRKVSIATPATKPKGGQFVLHAKALHGNLNRAGFVGGSNS